MRRVFGLLIITIFFNGCAESMALLGPASTSTLSGGNLARSATSTAINFGIKKHTGKTPIEHVTTDVEKHNPERKKTKCISFLESSESELCEILKNNIILTKNKIIKQKIVKSSKIEDLAKKSDIHKRR